MEEIFTYRADHDTGKIQAFEKPIERSKVPVRLTPSVKRSIVDIAFRRCSLRVAAKVNGVTEREAFDVVLEYLADRQERAIQAVVAMFERKGPRPPAGTYRRAA